MNKRITKKQGNQLIKAIKTLEIKDNDTIVITFNSIVTVPKLDSIYQNLRNIFKNKTNKVLFIPDNISIESLDREETIEKLNSLINTLNNN